MRLGPAGWGLALVVALASAPGCLLVDGASGVDPEAPDAGAVAALDAGTVAVLPFGPGASDPSLTWVRSEFAGIEFTRSEVTVAQYAACVDAGRCPAPPTDFDCNWGRPEKVGHPVNCVGTREAGDFCAWAGGRLPTEDELQAEASAGGERTYPWGDDDPTCDRVVMAEGGDGCGERSTWPVCSRPSGHSASGLCDLAGNVWEWVSTSDETLEFMPRGGGWRTGDPTYLAARARVIAALDIVPPVLGFRCARGAR